MPALSRDVMCAEASRSFVCRFDVDLQRSAQLVQSAVESAVQQAFSANTGEQVSTALLPGLQAVAQAVLQLHSAVLFYRYTAS